jgi:hypothetical protein
MLPPGACIIKLSIAIIISVSQLATVFVTVSYFPPHQIFAGKSGAHPSEEPYRNAL